MWAPKSEVSLHLSAPVIMLAEVQTATRDPNGPPDATYTNICVTVPATNKVSIPNPVTRLRFHTCGADVSDMCGETYPGPFDPVLLVSGLRLKIVARSQHLRKYESVAALVPVWHRICYE